MRIDLGNYVITADEFNIILNTKHVTKEGKRIGTEYLKPVGYYTSFHSLFQKLLTVEVAKSDLESIQEISNMIGQLSLDLSKLIREVSIQ